MNYKQIAFLLLAIVLLAYANESIAQCAMCRANAESNLKGGGTIAKGLNTGILYLMSIPYLILITLFFVFFKKQILQKIKAIRARFQST